jgi:energy-coupling factor transporter ATP-binding protein EcfA2
MTRCQIVRLPVTPIERLTKQFREYLNLPDPGPLYVTMSSVAANMIEGPPVWMMLIGSPGCGKTELLNSLLGVCNTVEAADIAGEAAFLSGTSKRDRSADATGGILREIAGTNQSPNGALVLNDFTSILSKADKIVQIMAVFREVYSGRWTRHIGAEGGRSLSWAGRMAVYAGVTGEIDQHHSLNARLGERWIGYRFDPRKEYFADGSLSISATRSKEWRQLLSAAVAAFFDELELSYQNPSPRREFTNGERIHLYQLAEIAVHCRSGVPRDDYSREINGSPETEIPTRLVSIFAQLLLGMERIGIDNITSWKLLFKIALDSMPKMRRIVIQTVHQKPITVEELTVPIGCCLSVAKRVVQDLEVHGVVHRTRGLVTLTDWMATSYSQLLALAGN